VTLSPRGKAVALVGAGASILAAAWLSLGAAPLMPLAAALIIGGFRHARSWGDALWCSVAGALAYHGLCAHPLFALVDYSWLAVLFFPMVVLYFLPSWLALFFGSLALERRVGLPRSVSIVVAWPVLEKLRTLGDLSLPVDLLAHSFGEHPAWLASTAWIGPFGLSLLVFVCGGLLVAAWDRRHDRWRALALTGLAAVAWCGPPIADVLKPPEAPGAAPLRVALVQPFVEVGEKLDRERWPALWSRLERLTRRAARGGVDLVVWPETTRPGPLIWRDGAAPQDPEVQRLVDELNVPILYGCEIARVRGRAVAALHNGAALARPGERRLTWYGKQRLLPFVEGVPFAGLFGGPRGEAAGRGERSSILTLLGHFRPGPQATVFEVGGARLGVLICYEAIYPQLGRGYRAEGANALLVLTNDAWWGTTAFARWHATSVSTAARMLDVPVLRAANSGISSVTDRRGARQGATGLEEITVLEADVAPGPAGSTFYARHGESVLAALLVLILGGSAVLRWTAAPGGRLSPSPSGPARRG
jgi:apolipoprotein N-acyltransferase